MDGGGFSDWMWLMLSSFSRPLPAPPPTHQMYRTVSDTNS
jgi:hypothetical protein